MTAEMIEKFIDNKQGKNQPVNIHFKERNTITGIFIKGRDYEEMKSKNFWRIVNANAVVEWNKTQDMSLSRLYNGLSFTKLS
ncbi:MAG TPA: short-chain dehydrogenase [Chitinophagaceae bacterium]|nr:short-chain dehydrogenase [Chitinophagaceae bacterium]